MKLSFGFTVTEMMTCGFRSRVVVQYRASRVQDARALCDITARAAGPSTDAAKTKKKKVQKVISQTVLGAKCRLLLLSHGQNVSS